MDLLRKIMQPILTIVILWAETEYVHAKIPGLENTQILSGWQNMDGSYTAAIKIDLEEDWKTYWHTTGETGIRPQFSFSGSKNVNSIRFIWPAPFLFGNRDIWSIGYQDWLVLPFIVVPKNKARPVLLELSAIIGVCEQICVSAEFEISEILRPHVKKRDPEIIAALASRPKTKTDGKVRDLECSFSRTQNDILVSIKLRMPNIGKREAIMVTYTRSGYQVRSMLASRNGLTLTGEAIVSKNSGAIVTLEPSRLFLTAVSEVSAVDLGSCDG